MCRLFSKAAAEGTSFPVSCVDHIIEIFQFRMPTLGPERKMAKDDDTITDC